MSRVRRADPRCGRGEAFRRARDATAEDDPEKVRGLKKLKSIADSPPKVVSNGECQEIVLTGDDVDITKLPIQTCWPGDPAPFITLPAVIDEDPSTGTRNVGMYRMQVIDGRSTYMHWQLTRTVVPTCSPPRTADPRRGGPRCRPRYCLLRERAAAAPHRRADARGYPSRGPGRAVDARRSTSRCRPTRRSSSRAGLGRDVGVEGPFGHRTGYYSHAECSRSSASAP